MVPGRRFDSATVAGVAVLIAMLLVSSDFCFANNGPSPAPAVSLSKPPSISPAVSVPSQAPYSATPSRSPAASPATSAVPAASPKASTTPSAAPSAEVPSAAETPDAGSIPSSSATPPASSPGMFQSNPVGQTQSPDIAPGPLSDESSGAATFRAGILSGLAIWAFMAI